MTAERRPGKGAALEEAGQPAFIVDLVSGSLREAALLYASAGWPVFPLTPGGKAPAVAKAAGGRGFKDASTDRALIERWWARWPSANIGTPTGVVFDVLDVDVRAHGDGWAALGRLRRAGLLRGCAGVARTRNGGGHFFFPASGQASHSLPFLDFKAAGGYVVLPPSRVPEEIPGGSGRYEWVDFPEVGGAPLDWGRVELLLRPALPKPAAAPVGAGGRTEGLVRAVLSAPVGSRNNTLFWALCRAAEAGLEPAEILAAGIQAGLDTSEVDAVLASATRCAGGTR